MSLTRAFTTKRNRVENDTGMAAPYIGRAASQRSPDSKPIKRSEISLPVALISTTNMLSYDAPDIADIQKTPNRNVSSASSHKSTSTSGDESDRSIASRRSEGTVTDASSVDESPSNSPEPNHLSCYFKPNVDTRSRASSSTRGRADSVLSSRPSFDSPNVPQRAPSHSKKAHVQLSHKRSMQRVTSQSSASSDSRRESLDMFSASAMAQPFASVPTPTSAPPTIRSFASASVPTSSSRSSAPAHPFSKELEQLTEVQEEYYGTVRGAEADADRAIMQAKGLVRYCAADYMQEISNLTSSVFQSDAMTYGGWI